jgi:hypothetical protein
MGIYLIDHVGTSGDDYAKITEKTEIGRFKSTGWNGNVVGNSTTSSYPEGFSSRVTAAT